MLVGFGSMGAIIVWMVWGITDMVKKQKDQ